MNKEKVIKFFKNPFNILFIILLIVTTIIYSKYQFVESIWLDETHYIWEAQLTKENPLYFFKINAYHLPVLIIVFFNLFFKSFIAGRLMGLFFSIGSIILVFVIGKRFRNSFVGFTAAFLLAYYHWWRFLAAKTLVDIATATLILLFAYLLYLFEENRNWKRLLMLIITGMFTLTVKVTGIIIIPITVFYYLIKLITYKDKKGLFAKIKDFFSGIKGVIKAIALIFILYLINKIVGLNLIHIINVFIKNFQFTYTLEILKLIIGEFGALIVILALIGTAIALAYKSKGFIIISLAYILFLISAIFFYEGVPEIRYLFPLFPLIYLIAAYSTDEVINYIMMFVNIKSKKYIKLGLRIIIVLIIFFIVIKPYYSLGNQIIENKNYAYTGYIEAMNWVSDNIKTAEGEHKGIKNIYIPNFFACCDYNVGLDRKDIRRVNSTAIFDTFDQFKEFLYREDNINKTIYLMPDMWETGQREWLYPITQEKYNTIVSLGFNLIYVVERPYPLREGIKKVPVILIFRRN